MNNQVVIDLKESERFYSIYKEAYSSRSFHEVFSFDTNKSINDNLNNLSFFALKESLPILYSFPTIFLDLISRWIENSDIDTQYKHSFDLNFSINSSIVVNSLSKLIGISSESTNMIEYYLSQNDIFSQLESLTNSKDDKNPQELELVLLAYFRFINHDRFKFKKFINPRVLNYFIQTQSKSFNVVRYLAVLILAVYLQSSEEVTNDMVKNHVDSTCLTSEYEGEQVDYKFLNLVEAKRISNFKALVASRPVANSTSPKVIVIEQQHLSKLVTSVYGILVPHLIASAERPQLEDFVGTDNAVSVLKQLATNIQNNRATLLFGKAGSGKTFLFNQLAKIMSYQDSVVKIHLGEQTDAKLLLGTYTSGEKPGTFKWRSGVLTTAVKEGKWVLIEDIDKAPTEVLSVLLTLLEKRQLIIPSRGEVIKAHNNFQIISTIRVSNDSNNVPDLIGMRLWSLIEVQVLSELELLKILTMRFPLLRNLIKIFIKCFNEILKVYSTNTFISLNRGSHPRIISSRDLFKFCERCNRLLVNNDIISPDQLIESSIYDNFFQEAVDCFGSAISEYNALIPLTNVIGECLEVPPSRINLFLTKHVPMFMNSESNLKVGRSILPKSDIDNALNKSKKSNNITSFATTNHSLRLMEQICVSIEMLEPVLLVGETGTGKTTVVQQVAKLMNKKLTVINVSQQTESGDLLGGYKPVNTKIIALPLQEIFENLFITTFSRKKNEKFSSILTKVFNRNQWKNVIKLWNEAIKMSKELLTAEINESESDDPSNTESSQPKKKRRLRSHERKILLDKWVEFGTKVDDFEIQSSSLDNSFVFNFVEGSLVNAIRNGDWLLLDEINLASSDTLESIADLLAESVDQRSILLSEKGDIEPIKAHPEFRIFGCMNPSTDVGKRDLPLSIRSRFTEIYVHSPDRDFNDLLAIIDKYIARFSVTDDLIAHDIANLYLEAKQLSESNKIVDGANQKPHFSIRTLTRTLIYVVEIVSIYGLRRSLYEGFCMSFLTLLDMKSEQLLKPIIEKYTINKLKNAKSVMSQSPPAPKSNPEAYVQFKHYWMHHGPEAIIPQPNYIITPFVEKNMLNLVRATAIRRFPVLIQGPTSAGKTSMIHYLANITGHKFVRINNHEHTDLQEYIGTYVSDSTGKLTFKEGVLVEAIRNGYWIVLDELNLAPTDILEALNRLLDDNRELFIPETQEVIHPHPDFMLFATQNPPGLYGGRKMLSRAFRNRFLELHFDDIPQDELEIILKERCQIAPSYCKKIVEVYKQLSIQRQSTRLFEQKNSFATLRDLFRWAFREAIGYEELAANGYMLLAERVRKEDEKLIVKETIEKIMRVKLDMDAYYDKLEEKALMNIESSIVWTKAMRRLAVLVFTSIKYKEPLLLVGETGCGKTTVCQVISQFLGQNLITVNAHQNTETSDILGAQRPVRNRFETRSRLFKNIVSVLDILGVEIPLEEVKLDDCIAKFNSLKSFDGIAEELLQSIKKDIVNSKILFEWSDGPLIHAMNEGEMFLLDEIALADDSVLERLNSVLEPERSLLLAEKGVDDSFIVANDKFQFLATMNPGGDYGKKELSPALRNRFTEIWVPSMDNFDDVRQIVESKLNPEVVGLTDAIVDFSRYYGLTYGSGNVTSGVISLRDILAWVQFINSNCDKIPSNVALLHGAAMVFIDALGTNNTAYLAENEEILKQKKVVLVEKLSELAGEDLLPTYLSDFEISLESETLSAGSFTIPRVISNPIDDFLLHAPTTSSNAMRVIRAMQVHKPILLEGSPGVGKTSLISAIAKATGNDLIRINLSEQTDLIDLFGSDTPAEGGKSGEFVWRDAPFLRAMQKGEWVLLDEMNLASQSVLEGLNACLDHRGEAYVPELDKSFLCHPDFTVFAAQNPQYQGGGRKGLPKSFVNRFTVVYVDVLKEEDLNMISQHLYPQVDFDISSKMIGFMSKLEEEVVVKKSWGSSGGPWEFNLRDTLRWLDLYNSKAITNDISPSDYFHMIICQRFRASDDRVRATELFESVFGKIASRDNYFNETPTYVQSGLAVMEKSKTVQYKDTTRSVALQCNYKIIEAALRCVKHNLPLILAGASNSGKTEIVRYMASVVGARLKEFAMNSDVDSMDILGGYEQVDLTRAVTTLISKLKDNLQVLILSALQAKEGNTLVAHHALEFFGFLENKQIDTSNFDMVIEFLKSFVTIYSDSTLKSLLDESLVIFVKMKEESSVKFEWFDGLLVQAVEKGDWLILDNANLCSPSVLDRLNSLLETNGSLIINECSLEDGSPRILKPHPNFRLFLTVDPKYGELSRAMRNRGVELYLEPLEERATSFDKRVLGIASATSNNPVTQHISRVFSKDRVYAQLHDIFNSNVQSTSLASVCCGLLEFSMFEGLDRWVNVVNSCSEFGDADGFYVNEIEERKDLFAGDFNILSSLHGVYKPILDDTYTSYQAINPAINSLILSVLSEEKTFVSSSEPIFFFQVAGDMLEFQKKLNQIEQKAMNGSMADLSYIERSAAAYLGRNIKSVPRLNVYGFLKAVNDFFIGVFRQASQDEIFKFEGIFKSLFNLDIIRKSLMDASHSQNESQIRVYRDLLSVWCEEACSKMIIKDQIISLRSAIEDFSDMLQLKTGFLMEKIWENFRGGYPDSDENWTKLDQLIVIFSEFDTVAVKQDYNSLGEIADFKQSLLSVYNSIVEGSISNEEFETVASNLSLGVEKLRAITETFSVKRKNDFQDEYNLLSMFVQASQTIDGGDSGDIIRMSSLAARPTIQFVNQKSKLFSPYPPIFENLCNIRDGKYNTIVPELFNDTLITNSLVKSVRFNETSGKFLNMKLQDMKALTKDLIGNSIYVLADIKRIFGDLLLRWISEIAKINGEEVEIPNLEALESLITQLPEPVKQVFQTYFEPAFKIVTKSTSKGQLGVAWVLFACGAIQSYLPSSAYDPAVKEHVIYDKVLVQQKRTEELVNSWAVTGEVLSGHEIHAYEVVKHEKDMEAPLKPRVFRVGPFDSVFEEWSAFMDSSINAEQVEMLLESAESLTQETEQLMSMFQNNSSQFLFRLDSNFKRFSDLNHILKGYVLSMKLGFDLITAAAKEKGIYKAELTSLTNVSHIGNFNQFQQLFSEFTKFTKRQKPDSQVAERVMCYFMMVSFAHGAEISQPILDSALQSLYYRWTLRKLKETEENIQSESLYKYKDPDVDIEEDFKTLFPDYEEVMEVDITSVNSSQSFDEIYYKIAKSYISAFTKDQTYSMNEIIKEGNTLISSLLDSKSKFKSGNHEASGYVNAVLSFGEAFVNFTQDCGSDFNFYRQSSHKETRRVIEIVTGIISFTKKLLNEWPDHATLREIYRVCNEFLDYPLNIPIARQLQKIEQIYTFISEWEKYAHSKISLKMYFDQLTTVIVSWRRLELSTWKELFNHEDKALEVNIGKWWFHLFETIIIPLISGEETSLTSLLSALNIFISQTTFGEFKFRLSLLRAFRQHVLMIDGKRETYNAISNFITFYEQFTSMIEDKLASERKSLEKSINEVILLASWKDVNIDALKQSARRSHNSLYKIVRKYRSVLATSVSTIIEPGLSEELKTHVSETPIPVVKGDVIDTQAVKTISSQVSTWSERPKRLQDISLVDKNMTVYVKRITEEELPTLYDYAKEILEESSTLRSETPTVYKEESKKLIASLKNEKAKLLSNCLKELRRIGLKTTSKPEVKKSQTSSNLLLSISTSFESTLLKGSDAYYFRIIDLLPRLKSAVLQLPDDVPQPDIEKGFAVAENLVYTVLVARQPLFQLSESVVAIERISNSFGAAAQLYDSNEILLPTTMVESTKINLETVRGIFTWLPRVLDLAIDALNSSALFIDKVSSDIFYRFKIKLSEFEHQLNSLNEISTTATTKYIRVLSSFIDDMKIKLSAWSVENAKVGFIANMILNWLQTRNIHLFIQSSTTISELKLVEDVETNLRGLSNSVIVVIQKITEAQSTEVTEADDGWFEIVQARLLDYIKSTHHKSILKKMNSVMVLIESIEHNSTTSKLVSAMVAFSMPIIKHYLQLTVSILHNARDNYVKTSHAGFIFLSILHSLATKGFCSPEAPSEEKTDDSLKDGTGLGDGEGAQNNSNDVEDDEDLSEQAQTDNKEKDDNKDEQDENDDAVEMDGDMAGDLEDASDQDDTDKEDDEGEDMDEEVDDIDDLDPNEVDEKMWDEEAKENNKEKESDKVPESNQNPDDMVANEEENQEGEKPENKENADDQEGDEENNDEEADNEKDVGEQEDDVKNDEAEKMDDFVPETDALELPDDMNLDGDDDGDDEEKQDDDKFDDMDVDETKEEDSEELKEDQEETENVEDANEEQTEAEAEAEADEVDDEEAADDEEGGNEVNEGDGDVDEEAMDSEDEALGENEQKEEEGGGDQEEQETAEGVDGANNDEAQDDIDVESAVKQEAGEKGEGADNQVVDEQDDLGASGAASNKQEQEQEKSEEAPQNDEANEMAKESIKQLGDALKEFHRRHQEIQQASKEQEQVEDKASERPDEFEHIEGENTNTDTQALGAADKEQVQSIDNNNAIDDDMEEDIEEEPEIKQENKDAEGMEVDENLEDVNEDDADADFKGKTKGGFVNDRTKVKDEAGLMNHELDEDILMDQLDLNDKDVAITQDDVPPMSLDVARDLWRHSELATQELASGLCEQLRLILEPTLATKLKGDYKTGKRLNMKRIIPYIASEFRKDKIWLRRTKPSKRQYQIMIAVDDSKSMSESKSTELAFHSIALVSKALTQLESGGLSIVRFGEDVKVVHPFEKPFSNQESGAKIFQYFDFQQTRTDIKNLCAKSLSIFENAKISSSSNLWQLQIIISDGVCEDHETIQALVRKARESRIMLVFVVIDGINSNESILDMSQVKYEFDSNGQSVLKVDKYLDSFPFEFYVVVRDINELPEMLSLILRQYFSEMATLSS
ncbi:AAA ATPase midasin [Yamadazyma tenuis]|uniref:AAA ATPase midasin n=1 Tax=Candida tenuis TaxID=2315449 RepID=UPI0027AA7E44|nr:AAA ATPase midasin [Yamadazyma tenuis]